MDLLEKLNIPALPEQQTKVECDSVVKALEADQSIRLGFDACLTCAGTLSSKPITCKRCKRVSYCSKKCREDDEGHSPIVCSLLKLCNADEDVEEGSGDLKDDEEAEFRVRSELESYPATLANVLMDFPTYQSTLRGKRNRQLTIHLIGASDEAELWGSYQKCGKYNVFEAYTEALLELAETYSLSQINLLFIGPNCKSLLKENYLTLDDGKGNCRILFEGIKGNYDTIIKSNSRRSEADVIVLFNPGLTCPDYNWNEVFVHLKSGVPYLISSNTELESIMDSQWLFENKYSKGIPEEIIEMIRAERQDDENKDSENDDEFTGLRNVTECGIFFAMNPWAGKRIRQSGNFGNDLFVKSNWVLGGKIADISAHIDSQHFSENKRSREETKVPKKKMRKGSALI